MGGSGMTEYAVAITFPQTSTTYEGFGKLSAAADQYGVRSAGIVERDAHGNLRVPESGDTAAGLGIAGGSVIGMLLGWSVVEPLLGSPREVNGSISRALNLRPARRRRSWRAASPG
jgi:uncharacterized membrane protein